MTNYKKLGTESDDERDSDDEREDVERKKRLNKKDTESDDESEDVIELLSEDEGRAKRARSED